VLLREREKDHPHGRRAGSGKISLTLLPRCAFRQILSLSVIAEGMFVAFDDWRAAAQAEDVCRCAAREKVSLAVTTRRSMHVVIFRRALRAVQR
jgi:hypothetical protein